MEQIKKEGLSDEKYQIIDDVLMSYGTFSPPADNKNEVLKHGYAAGCELINDYPHITKEEVEKFFQDTKGIWEKDFERSVIEAFDW